MSTARPWTAAAATLITAALLALVAPAGAGATTCANADLAPAPGVTAPVQQAVACLVNVQRAAAGLPPLAQVPVLDGVASAYAQKMLAEDFFDHVAPDGSTLGSRLGGAGYDFAAAGEDIGEGSGPGTTAALMVSAWMASPEHRANILEPAFTQIGVGAVPGAPGSPAGATYVADFGTPTSALPDTAGASSGTARTAVARPRHARRHRATRRCTKRRAQPRLCRPARRHRRHA